LIQYILNKDSKISFLIQQYIKTLFRKNKRRALTQYMLNKDSKIFSLIRRHIETLFRKDKR